MSERVHPRTAGFRFWPTDAIFLGACALAGWLLRDDLGAMVWMIPVAAGHFFLFCNLFRVRRSYELLWTALFLANFAAWFFSGAFSWAGVLGVQAPITLGVLILEVVSPRYHGILWRWINARRTEAWLRGE